MDIIKGPVINVVDGDTFDLKVTHIGNQNHYQYNGIERIRIAEIDKPELNTHLGLISKYLLQQKLNGKEVQCYVQARDNYSRIVAKVKVLN